MALNTSEIDYQHNKPVSFENKYTDQALNWHVLLTTFSGFIKSINLSNISISNFPFIFSFIIINASPLVTALAYGLSDVSAAYTSTIREILT